MKDSVFNKGMNTMVSTNSAFFSLDNVVVDTTSTYQGSFQFFVLFSLLFSNPEFPWQGHESGGGT
jgi:hypothetical protein